MSPAAPKPSKRAVVLSALAVAAALGFLGWRIHQHRLRNNPPPLPPLENVLPVIPKDQEKQIRTAVKLGARTLLKVTPDQEKRMDDLWKQPPRSIEELIEFNKKVDAILTPQQVEKARPLRRMLRHAVLDRMLEGAGKRLSPNDFEKFKNEIKARVDRRIEGS